MVCDALGLSIVYTDTAIESLALGTLKGLNYIYIVRSTYQDKETRIPNDMICK